MTDTYKVLQSYDPVCQSYLVKVHNVLLEKMCSRGVSYSFCSETVVS